MLLTCLVCDKEPKQLFALLVIHSETKAMLVLFLVWGDIKNIWIQQSEMFKKTFVTAYVQSGFSWSGTIKTTYVTINLVPQLCRNLQFKMQGYTGRASLFPLLPKKQMLWISTNQSINKILLQSVYPLKFSVIISLRNGDPSLGQLESFKPPHITHSPRPPVLMHITPQSPRPEMCVQQGNTLL